MPVLKLNVTIPSDTLIPDPDEVISSKITTIYELELKVSDRDQKIIFYNNEIKKFQEEIKTLIIENKQLSDYVLDSKNQLSLNSSNNEDSKRIKNDNKKKFQNLNNIIKKNTNERNELIKSIEILISKNELLKKEYKTIFNNSMRLKSIKDVLENKIKEQASAIDKLKLSIQTLKDKSHHR